MEKIIHKLDKKIRYQIAVNYVNDKYNEDLKKLTKLADLIAKNLIEKYHSKHESVSESSISKLCELMDKNNISTQFYNAPWGETGVVAINLEYGRNSRYGRSLPVRIYKNNCIQYCSSTNSDFTNVENFKNSEDSFNYHLLIHNNSSDEIHQFITDFETVRSQCSSSFDKCYDLLKKVRTAELLMKHWSNAHKYLPQNMEIEEPNSLSLSEKFKLL